MTVRYISPIAWAYVVNNYTLVVSEQLLYAGIRSTSTTIVKYTVLSPQKG